MAEDKDFDDNEIVDDEPLERDEEVNDDADDVTPAETGDDDDDEDGSADDDGADESWTKTAALAERKKRQELEQRYAGVDKRSWRISKDRWPR